MSTLEEAIPTNTKSAESKDKMSLRRVHFLVHGKVQGVFFRKHTAEAAAVHNITGYCLNTPDGKVQGEAQGRDTDMKEFLKIVDKGPKYAQVVRLDTEERHVLPDEKEFEVRRGKK